MTQARTLIEREVGRELNEFDAVKDVAIAVEKVIASLLARVEELEREATQRHPTPAEFDATWAEVVKRHRETFGVVNERREYRARLDAMVAAIYGVDGAGNATGDVVRDAQDIIAAIDDAVAEKFGEEGA